MQSCNQPFHFENSQQLRDFSAVRKYLCCRLLNAQHSTDFLEEVPHRPFLDLAVVYDICLPVSGEKHAAVPVTNTKASDWDICEPQLFETALANMQRDCPPVLVPVSDLLEQSRSGLIFDSDALPLYVLTNRCKYFGAGTLLYAGILQNFCDRAGDFYILPSSLHEVLLLPVSHAPSAEALNEIIRDVNRSHLDPADFLSDHCYLYTAESRCIEQIF